MKKPYFMVEVYGWDAEGNTIGTSKVGLFPNRKEAVAAMQSGRNYLLYKAVLAQKVTTSTHIEAYD